MKSLYLLPIIPLLLASCSKEEVVLQKHFSTYSTQSGNITVKDDIIGTVEWGKTSALAFRSAGIVSDIYVLPGDTVKKWQILARLGNRESSIQSDWLKKVQSELESLGLTTNAIRIGTEGIKKTTETLYDARIASLDMSIRTLELNIEKAKQNLSNQTSWLGATFSTFANDFDRISTSMLFEWDRILGMTTNFEYANDGWEPYLWARAGSSQKESEDAWNQLYATRGIIRRYTETGATITDMTKVIEELRLAYIDARMLATRMNTMFENSIVGADLSRERLDGWITAWNGQTLAIQWSESNYTTWRNTNQNLTNNSSTGSSVASKDIEALSLELENTRLSRTTLLAEKAAKLQEIDTNVNTVKWKKWEVTLQLEETKLNTALAVESSEYSIIRAPYDGIILEKYGEEGMVVSGGTPLIRMTSDDRKIVKTYIDNTLYNYSLQSILLATDEEDNYYTGQVSLIQEQKDPLHNKNYTEVLLSGTGVIGTKVTLHLERKKSSLQNGTLIPLSSILTRYGPPGVYILENGIAHFTLVEVLGSDMVYAEVLGIPEWSTIITDGKENIYDWEKLD